MNQPNPEPVEAEEAIETAIGEYKPIAGAIAGLRSKYVGVVYDVESPAGMAECRKARAEVRKHRTTLETVRQQIKGPVIDLCRRIDADAKAITQALLAIETPLDVQVRTEEAAAEARREARRRADEERQAALRHMVESINAWPVSWVGGTTQQIREAIAGYEQHEIPSDIPPHYHRECTGAKERALGKLREMLAGQEAREAEERRLAAERRAESERQAAEDKRLREERAELDRQHAEHARIERELADERARIDRERVREERRDAFEPSRPDVPWEGSEGTRTSQPSEPPAPSEPSDGAYEPVFQAEAEPEPSDALVLRGLAHALERGGQPYAWIPNRLRAIAARLEAMDAAEFVEEASEWP
jgi:hypothetical protein